MKGQPFCAMRAAQILVQEAREVGTGRRFSLAVVFACQEFESWFVVAANSLVGKSFPDGRIILPEAVSDIPPCPESSPRDAKGWLNKKIPTGYNPVRDQQGACEDCGSRSHSPEDAILSAVRDGDKGAGRGDSERAANQHPSGSAWPRMRCSSPQTQFN